MNILIVFKNYIAILAHSHGNHIQGIGNITGKFHFYISVFSRKDKGCVFTWCIINENELCNWLRFCVTRRDVPGLIPIMVLGNFQVT